METTIWLWRGAGRPSVYIAASVAVVASPCCNAKIEV